MIAHNDISDSVAKLISNLGHFCEARELDFIALVQQGVSCWRAEMEADDIAREFTAKTHAGAQKCNPEKEASHKALKERSIQLVHRERHSHVQ